MGTSWPGVLYHLNRLEQYKSGRMLRFRSDKFLARMITESPHVPLGLGLVPRERRCRRIHAIHTLRPHAKCNKTRHSSSYAMPDL